MKRNKAFVAAALVLGIFFLLQFGGEFFFAIGKDKIPEAGLKNLRMSMKLFPLLARYPGEAGFALLEKGIRDNNPAAVKESITYFYAAAKKNPLDYQSRYYLAKAYLWLSAVNNDYFDLGVRELKNAARIRGSNIQIALDCGKIFFSIWPLLEEKDQRFASGLLAAAMPIISWVDFSGLLEMWALYVQDVPLLMKLLQGKPEFFGPAADQLLAASISMEQRCELLNLHEIYSLDFLERRYNELSQQGEIGLEDTRTLLNQSRQLKGYYRLQPQSKFSPEKLAKLQRFLLLQVISGLLTDAKAQADPGTKPQVREYIQIYIDDHSGLNDLDDLQKLLQEKNYFKNNDFPSLYLKTLIAYKKSSYGGIITEIEALRKTMSFVKEEQLADYTAILLLLVDSYYSNKLLTAAENVAKELYENQPENPDVLFRVLRIRNILGVEGAPDQLLDAKLETVQNSRFINAVKANGVYDVFFFNAPEIEITLDSALRTQLKPKQLVQVFMDGKIAFESYVEGLPEKIVIGPPFTGIERKAMVQINIL